VDVFKEYRGGRERNEKREKQGAYIREPEKHRL